MAEEMSHCKLDRDGCIQPEQMHADVVQRPGHKLPTLQRNALRRIFDRPEFAPEEVAELGYRRLQQAEGIGPKGLTEIAAWLKAYGFELSPPNPVSRPNQPAQKKTRKSIELAVRLLRTHGYVVQPSAEVLASQASLGLGVNPY